MTFFPRKLDPARRVTVAALASVLAFLSPTVARATPLMPQTKIRLIVVQWVPAKGDYARWDAVGGDYTVSAAGALSLPLIGTMDVSGLDEAAVASAIERRLKETLGLVALPNAVVEVVELPPVYVVGWIAAPGSYEFRDGLTVLQALALGGGVYRAPVKSGSDDQINLLGELKKIRSEILYALGRRSRLGAEQADRSEIAFPAELLDNPNRALANAIVEQENLIFKTRADSLARQLTSLTELGTLFAAEIDGLKQKGMALDRGLRSMQDEFLGVDGLVKRGVATVSRRSELERAISVMQSQRLDQVTAIIRARQSSNEAVRSALTLKDKRRMDIATELQEADTNLEGLRTRLEIAERLLLASPDMDGTATAEAGSSLPSFTIVRQAGKAFDTLSASETSLLRPGDVVKVSPASPVGGSSDGTPFGGRAGPAHSDSDAAGSRMVPTRFAASPGGPVE